MRNWIEHRKFDDDPWLVAGFLTNISIQQKEKEPIFKSSFDDSGLFGKETKKINKIGFKYNNRQ